MRMGADILLLWLPAGLQKTASISGFSGFIVELEGNGDTEALCDMKAFLTCRIGLVTAGHLLEGHVVCVQGLRGVELLLGVSHTGELGGRPHCNPSTWPLDTSKKL